MRAAASENPGRLPGPGQCLISSGGLSAGLEYPSLRHIIDEYLAFQEELITRRTKYDLSLIHI